MHEILISEENVLTVLDGREAIKRILDGADSRIIMIVGPCSIHDPEAGLEYAERLAGLAKQVQEHMLVVMRVYFEKPRTSTGWKGLINDPRLDGSCDMDFGYLCARRFLKQVVDLGLPTATEFVDTITPEYVGELVAWAALGARTVESQTHRQLFSGISAPWGAKNGTGGNKHSVDIAVNALVAGANEHTFQSVDYAGRPIVVDTKGNLWGHLVLRGGVASTNYGSESIDYAVGALGKAGLRTTLMVDCSHDNSRKDHTQQPIVFEEVLAQRLAGNRNIVGVMIESNLNAGQQEFVAGVTDPAALRPGFSITDACMGWEQTEEMLLDAYERLRSAAA